VRLRTTRAWMPCVEKMSVREPISLDQTIGDEGNSQLGDFIEDSQAVVAIDSVSLTCCK
jgi:DNA-directed RNA polymerase sigma subunit (sigma70/sigma32)